MMIGGKRAITVMRIQVRSESGVSPTAYARKSFGVPGMRNAMKTTRSMLSSLYSRRSILERVRSLKKNSMIL